MFFTKLTKSRYIKTLSIPFPPISSKHTLTHTQKPTQNPNPQKSTQNSKPNELTILNHLSLLLPIRHQFQSTQESTQESTKKSTQPDERLLSSLVSPEDRLRGVFVQKIVGKAAAKRALSAALSDIEGADFREVVSKVMNRGGLDSENIVTVFEWAKESGKMSGGVESYNIVFKALGRRRFFDYMRVLLKVMRDEGVRGDHETLEIFVDSYVKAKRVSKGVEILKNLDEFGIEWDLECLKVVLRCLCRRGRLTSADKLLGKTRGKVDGETYGIVLRGWCKLGRVREIERVLEEMVEDGFDPDSLTFSYLIEGLGRGGRINDAVNIFENLKETKTCEVNVVVYNAITFRLAKLMNV